MPRFPFPSHPNNNRQNGDRHETGPPDRGGNAHGLGRGVPPASLNGYNGRGHFGRGTHGRGIPGSAASANARAPFNHNMGASVNHNMGASVNGNMGASVNGNMGTFVNGNIPVRSFHDTGAFPNGNVGAFPNGNTGSFHYGGIPDHHNGNVPGHLNGNMPRLPHGNSSDRPVHNMGIAVDGIMGNIPNGRVGAPVHGIPEVHPNDGMEFPPFYNTGGPVSYNMAGPYNHHVPDLWHQGGQFMPGLSDGNTPNPTVHFNQPYHSAYPSVSSTPLLGQMYRRAGPRSDQRIHWFGGGYSATYGPTDPVPLFTLEDAFLWQVEEIERLRIALRVAGASGNRSNEGNVENVYGAGLAHGDNGLNAGRRNQTYDNRNLVEDIGFARSYFGVHAGARPTNTYTGTTFQPAYTYTGYKPADTYTGFQSAQPYTSFQSAPAFHYNQINGGENGDDGPVTRAPPPTPEYIPGVPRQTPYGMGELNGLINAFNHASDTIPEMTGYTRSDFNEAYAYRLSPTNENERPRTVQTPVINNAAFPAPGTVSWEDQTPDGVTGTPGANLESTISSPKSDSDVLWHNLRRSYNRIARRPSPFPFQYFGSPEHSPNYVAFGPIDEGDEEGDETGFDEEEEFAEEDVRWTWS